MYLSEENRVKLVFILETLQRATSRREISGRKVARAAGWHSHTHMQRLLRGEERTLSPEPALRIVKYLNEFAVEHQVPIQPIAIEDLFLVRESEISGHSGRVRQAS